MNKRSPTWARASNAQAMVAGFDTSGWTRQQREMLGKFRGNSGSKLVADALRPGAARENAGAMGWRLTAEEVAELEAASDAVGFEFSSGGFKLE